jgi:hypothetical protein
MKNYILLVKALFIAHKQYYTISNTPLHLVLCSKISYFITPFFIYLKVKPNFITMMNFILSVISIMILIFSSHYFVWAIIIYIFYKILDFVDGSIARYNSISTFYGRFIDGLADIFFQSFFIFALSFYYFIKLQDNNLVKFKNPRNISLIDAQNIKEIKKKFPNLEPIDLRRNILTENLNLNSLINRYFKINDVLLKGVEFCKGCKHIEEYTKCEGLIDVLLLNGGIRAEVIESGFVKINDTIKRVLNA